MVTGPLDSVQRAIMRYPTTPLTRLRRTALVALFVSASAVCWAATKGPDAGGYRGTDETVFSFVDISSSGAASVLADTDDGTAALTLPFAFRFYGHPYTLVCASSNGAMYFVPNEPACNGLNDFANTDLTSTQTPGNYPAVLPFWSDLTFQVAGGGTVLYQSQGVAGSRRFIVQWNNAYPQGSANPVTFQAILSEGTNRILFQYKKVDLGQGNPTSKGGQATVGIRNAGAPANDQEIAWSYNAPVIADNSALLFAGSVADTTPPIVTTSASPSSLWPPNGQTVPVTVSGTITDATSGVNPATGHFAVTDEYGQVHPAGTFSIATNGQYSFTVALVSSRNGNDNDGRKYTITVTAADVAGNQGSGSAVVTVPRDQSGK